VVRTASPGVKPRPRKPNRDSRTVHRRHSGARRRPTDIWGAQLWLGERPLLAQSGHIRFWTRLRDVATTLVDGLRRTVAADRLPEFLSIIRSGGASGKRGRRLQTDVADHRICVSMDKLPFRTALAIYLGHAE